MGIALFAPRYPNIKDKLSDAEGRRLATERAYDVAVVQAKERGTEAHRQFIRVMAKTDLYFLATRICKRTDMQTAWHFLQAEMFEKEGTDRKMDLWFREAYKSTFKSWLIIIQRILNDPESCHLIMSFNKTIAIGFLRHIKQELENNDELKWAFPEILWERPSMAPSWSERNGITVNRESNRKETTVFASGLVDGQPTSVHYFFVYYDDIVSDKTVGTPGAIEKAMQGFKDSINLGTADGERTITGTVWHYNGPHLQILKMGMFEPRIYTATVDGERNGEPVLWTQKQLEERIALMGDDVAGPQLFMNPQMGSTSQFDVLWLAQRWDPRSRGWGDMNVYIIVDPANSKKPDGDYTTYWVIGLDADHKYRVIDFIRDKLDTKERLDMIFNLVEMYRPLDVKYEIYGKDSEVDFIRREMELRDFYFMIEKAKGQTSKPDRIRTLRGPLVQGMFIMPYKCIHQTAEGHYVDMLQDWIVDEYQLYPYAEHDDGLDGLARTQDPDLSWVFPMYGTGESFEYPEEYDVMEA